MVCVLNNIFLGPILGTWFSSLPKWIGNCIPSEVWVKLLIHFKLQKCNGPINGCNYLSTPELKLIYASKGVSGGEWIRLALVFTSQYVTIGVFWNCFHLTKRIYKHCPHTLVVNHSHVCPLALVIEWGDPFFFFFHISVEQQRRTGTGVGGKVCAFKFLYGYSPPGDPKIDDDLSNHRQLEWLFSCLIWQRKYQIPRHWPFARGIHRWPVDSPHMGQ